ncbi:RCC1 domain-containing protein [Microbacterium sp. A94]|uniref:RCC1 domain-containing protein n=1 Tax=Microbacterium sp. A94 TaxID=3450717 RepID=UPI003F434114
MMLRNVLRGVLAVSVAVGLVGVGATANAAPDLTSAMLAPTSGPLTGGTEVTIEPPPGVTFTQVSVGIYHSVALAEDGTAYAWGRNNYGQLGNDATTNSSVPVQVEMPAEVTFTQVSAGGSHTVALTADGTAYAWGSNDRSQLGNDQHTESSVPVLVQIPDGVRFTQVSAGNRHSVAVDEDGTAYAWGLNADGQLGNDATTNSSVPVQVQIPDEVTVAQVSAGTAHSVAVDVDGTAYAWGNNEYGQLGNGASSRRVPVPVQVQMPAKVTVTQVSAGGFHSVAVAVGGATYAWGVNNEGQLGTDTTRNPSVPGLVQIPAEVTVTQVSAGHSHSVALTADGTAYAWGLNANGQLGNRSFVGSRAPVRVQMPADVTFTQVSAGNSHSAALTEDGTAYAWGANFYGQVGDGTEASRNVPTPVLKRVTVTGVSFGGKSATNLVDNDDGSWTATTPPHTAGPVDVVVSWALNDMAQPDITYADAFTYVVPDVAPTVTDPVDQAVTAGDPATFTVDTTGTPEPGVTWEFSTDDGATWTVVGAADGTVSGDGKTLTVTATEALSGTLYRATAENTVGAASSNAATLTVTAAPVAPTVTDPVDQVVTAGDPATFTVDTTGTPEPGVTWELSTDDGGTWTVVGAADGTVSGDGKTLTVTATEALSGFLYRATAENTVGTVTSAAATLTVTAAPVAPTVTDPVDQVVTAGDPATFTVDTTGTPEPSLLWELSTDDGGTWSAVTAADGTVSGDRKNLTVTATEALSGTLYRAIAENTVGVVTSNAATLTVSAVPVAPTVTDPVDQVVTAGDPATFTVDTTGTPEPGVTWELSADDGATWSEVGAADGTVSSDGKTLTVTTTEALSGFQYRVTVENSVDAVTSAPATLTVTAAPVAPTVTDPADQSVTAGDAATFTVETTGTPEPSLSWEFSTDNASTWGPVGAADGTVRDDGKTLTVAATEASSGFLYRVTAENSVDAVTSEAATLTVTAAPVAPTVSDPADQVVTAGDAAMFTVEATGTPVPSLLWEFSTDDGVTWGVVGAADGTVRDDGKTLTVAASEALSGFRYRVTAENSVDAVTSNAATLTVTAAPVAPTVTDPEDQEVTAGDAARFTVEATGTPVPSLLWEFSTDDGGTWSAVGAADGTVSDDGKTLTIAATEALSGFQYRATAENTVDAVTSAPATLTVTAAPVAPTVSDPADQVVTAGDEAMFTVEATGTPVPSLLWEFSTDDGVTWGPVGAADGTVRDDGKTLTVTATEALSGVLYRVTAENSVDAVTSAPATLTVTAVPVAPTVSDPEDQAVTAGDAAMFTVEATGTPVPSLLWEFSTDDGVTWSAVGAADGTVRSDGKTLTVAATEALSGVLYRVTAENSVGAVTSAVATLTVSAAPVIPPVTDPVAPPVTDPVGETDLARTGSDPVPAIAAAVLFALIGAGLLLASRRKHA